MNSAQGYIRKSNIGKDEDLELTKDNTTAQMQEKS